MTARLLKYWTDPDRDKPLFFCQIEARFGEESRFVLSTEELPTKVEVTGVIGPHDFHTLDDLKEKRDQEVIFLLAKLVLERFFRDDERQLRPWRFPRLLRITTHWYNACVTCKGNTFKQLLYFQQFALEGADRIYRGIVAADVGTHRLVPILLSSREAPRPNADYLDERFGRFRAA